MILLATVFAGPGRVLWLSAAVVAVVMVVVWAVSLRLRDASIIDPVWGPAFALVALIAALAGNGDPARRWLLFAATAAWGLRLGVHLTRRKLTELRDEDRRYAAMRTREGDRFSLWSLWAVFGTQGLLIVIVSLPIQVAANRPGALSATIPGVIVFLVGLAFEGVGDEQLRRFKADPANQGKVLNHGLWRYTRHPNYFGDSCIWWGIWLVALPAGGTWWTVVGPAIMTLFLVRISGKAMLERDIGRRRPEYRDYIKRTSGFFPLPPR